MPKRYPLLHETAPERLATADRPAASPTWTNALSKDGPPTLGNVTTLYESFRNACKQWPHSPCLGHRPMVDGVAQAYEWITYHEAEQQVASLSAAFKAVGLQRLDKVGVLGTNSPQWMLAMQACNRMNYVCVPLYETLGDTAIEYILEHGSVKLVVIQGRRLGRLAKALAQVAPMLAVVVWGPVKEADLQAVRDMGNTVLTFGDAVQLGSKHPVDPDPPKPEDLSTLMYTSGTTGDPKGVMITHAALVATIAGCNQMLEATNETLRDGDSYLSFLPLAHVFDRLAEEFMLNKGGCVGYWQGEIPKVLDDILALRPSLFCGVPRVFDRIFAGINEQSSKNIIRWAVFQLAVAAKSFWMKRGWRHDKASPLADLLVFSTIKKRLGGRVRLILSGAAPLATPVQEMLSCCMCAPVLQGYGLTETCAASTIAEPYNWSAIGTVGGPIPGVEIRLEAVPEMGYLPTAEPPAGEVCIRGPTVFRGYYGQEELTAQSVDEDGFFHTGDIAQLVGRGTLQIIDRKKNIFKLSQGEYVAVEKIENVYKTCRFVEQLWVYGNSFEAQLVAVVVPEAKALAVWAASKGLTGSYEELALLPATKAHLFEELTAVGVAGKLKGFEQVKAIHIETEQFSVDNDLFTPTFKLKRPQLQARYEREVKAMYSSLRPDDRYSSSRPAALGGGGKGGARRGAAVALTAMKGASEAAAPHVIAATAR